MGVPVLTKIATSKALPSTWRTLIMTKRKDVGVLQYSGTGIAPTVAVFAKGQIAIRWCILAILRYF
jgi:hypothetical protein